MLVRLTVTLPTRDAAKLTENSLTKYNVHSVIEEVH